MDLTVFDTHLNGSYLITFNGTSIINNIFYTNVDNKILEYITARKYTDFLISEYIISNDSELSFDNINVLNPFIQIKQSQIPVTLILIKFAFIFLIIMIIIKFRNFLIFKPWQIRIFTREKLNLNVIRTAHCESDNEDAEHVFFV